MRPRFAAKKALLYGANFQEKVWYAGAPGIPFELMLNQWMLAAILVQFNGLRIIANFSGIKEKCDALMPGVEPWRFHDLRRSMRTGLSALRIADTVSELCIAHTQKGLHKIYDQHAYLDEKRNAFDAWANHVLAICEPGAPSNVIQIAARG